MKFEEALKAMREGKKVWYSGFNKDLGWDNNSYLQIHDGQICYYVNGLKKPSDELSEFHFNIFESPFILKDGWVIVDDKYYSILKSVEEISPKDLEKLKFEANPCSIEESKTDKIDQIDLKITFIGGGEIVIPDEQWDDYRYDGKFFTIIKDGTDIAMYNAKEVFSVVLVRQGEG
jgi:hypothetical protein